MKKIFTTILFALVAVTTWAYDVCVDGICYNLVSKVKTAEVTYKISGYASYSGSVSIPSTIVYNGATYSVTSIGEHAFEYCSSLTSVTIPNSVVSIGEEAFRNINLTSITIPNSVVNIEYGAFLCCSSLTSVSIGNYVKSLGQAVFYGCTGLTEVTIPTSMITIGAEVFRGCTGLTTVNIPNYVESIGPWAFEDCTGLTLVNIGNSVTSIGADAFIGCSALKTVTIGKSVESIRENAFASCKNLESVTCHAEKVPSMGTDVFKDSYVGYATLKVPDASLNLYTAADQWKDFGTIQGINGGGETPKCAKPTISYVNNELVFSTETEGAEIVSEVTCTDVKKSYDAKVPLSLLYTVTAYATKVGYDNSETATATFPLNIGERGDVNGDGTINVLDVNCVVDKITTSK